MDFANMVGGINVSELKNHFIPELRIQRNSIANTASVVLKTDFVKAFILEQAQIKDVSNITNLKEV